MFDNSFFLKLGKLRATNCGMFISHDASEINLCICIRSRNEGCLRHYILMSRWQPAPKSSFKVTDIPQSKTNISRYLIWTSGPLQAHETSCKLINQPPLRTTPRSLMRPSRHKPSENSQYMTLRSYYVYPRVGLRSVIFLIPLFGGKN